MLDLTSTDSTNSYRDIFELRGQLYHQAMRTYQDVRKQEFLSVIAQADLAPNMIVVDVPSGGAYISRYVADIELVGMEVSHSFAELAALNDQKVILYENDRFPLKADSVDRILSIAGLHHVEDKRAIFSEMLRITKPRGRLVLADVAEDSYVRRFLDDFVGRYCETGHSGWYFGDATRKELREVGLDIVGDRPLNYLWCASDVNQLAEFCRLLFGMTKADTATVARGIVDYLGIQELDYGVGLNWQLHCFTCKSR